MLSERLVAEASRQLGAGALLGWLALPLLVRLARRCRRAPPVAYYRALVTALSVAALLSLAPLVRGLLGGLGLSVELPLSLAARGWDDTAPMLLVTDWVSPIVGSPKEPWAAMPLARALSALGALWLGWLVLGGARSLASRWRLGRAYRHAPCASPRVLERAATIAAEFGLAPPAIRVADGVVAAFTFGFFSPVVVLGRGAERASDDELDFVLRHELTHVRRGDARMALWIELAQRCFGGHPCLRWLATEIRFAREAAVDEAAAGPQPLEYARFLLGLADEVRSLRAPPASLVSMADTALERRIEMLMSKREGRRPRLGAAWLGMSGLVLGALVCVAPATFAAGGDAGDSQKARVEGNLTVEQVQRAIFGKPRPMIDCYNQLPAPRENLQVRVVFTIAENGSVKPGARAVVPAHPELAPCLAAALHRFVFPAPASGTVDVDMPTELSPPFDERNAIAEAREGVSQRLAPEVIRGVVRGFYDEFRTCYETLGRPLPTTQARLKFSIARDGKVSDGEVKSEQYPALGKCLDPVMRSMVFPAPEDGIVSVEYPLAFEPAKIDSPDP